MAPGPDYARRPNQVTFSLSGPSSAASSRTSSPAPTPPTSLREEYLLEKVAQNEAGLRPMDVYDATLPAWRAAVRRALVAQIRVESVLVAKMQRDIGACTFATRTRFLRKTSLAVWRNEDFGAPVFLSVFASPDVDVHAQWGCVVAMTRFLRRRLILVLPFGPSLLEDGRVLGFRRICTAA
ncbi:hypothetical protein DFH08DRAFT_515029 [Mycena albidolilacea]|uniref:Uncharacterized protein n=1 Tax=Mycena albidolilacea TaxID=1033008 RepID=A0AAD6Z3U5_9AGAR|nr:hypothetical protein DFH08DRAFT_515029 [Mycena albidolilacea]